MTNGQKSLLAVNVLLHAADIYLTNVGMSLGMGEANPLARFAMSQLGVLPGLLAVKLAIVPASLWVLVKYNAWIWIHAQVYFTFFVAVLPWVLGIYFGW